MRKFDLITSRNNPKIKWVASLSEKKKRNAYSAFFVEGEKLLIEALESSLPVSHVFIRETDAERINKLISNYSTCEKFGDTEIIYVSESVFEKISTEKSPEGVITVIKYLDFFHIIDIIYKEEFFSSPSERVLALCSVRDPGNLGAVIRSAVAFGVDHIVLSQDCADIYNHKTIRAAMGGLFKIKISIVKDFDQFILCAKDNGRRIYAAELNKNAISLPELDMRRSDIFIIGNEGHGIPYEISRLCTSSVYIPISPRTESLNASVAAAMFMWEQNKVN